VKNRGTLPLAIFIQRAQPESCGYAPARAWEVVILPITYRPRGGALECVAKIFPNLLKKVLDKDDLLWYLSKY
jgi:hypothetical protein